MNKNNKKIDKKCLKNKIEEIWSDNKFDPNGSYLGMGIDEEEPIQDADDL